MKRILNFFKRKNNKFVDHVELPTDSKLVEPMDPSLIANSPDTSKRFHAIKTTKDNKIQGIMTLIGDEEYNVTIENMIVLSNELNIKDWIIETQSDLNNKIKDITINMKTIFSMEIADAFAELDWSVYSINDGVMIMGNPNYFTC